MYTIERIDDVSSLRADSRSWDALSDGVPLRESAWLGNWWQVFGAGREAYLVTVRDAEGRLCGLLPLYRSDSNREGRSLYAMGDGATCTDHFSVLARQQDAAAICEAIARWLIQVHRDPRDGWDLIALEGVVGGDRSMARLADAFRSGGAITHATSRMNTWAKDTSDDWESHLMGLSKTHRRKSRKQRKMLDAATEVQVAIAATKEEVREGVEILIELHQRRWNAVGESGSFADPRSRQFLHAAAQDLFDRDQLQLASIEYQGRTICSELRIIGRDRVMYCYTTGMDMDYGDVEPGRLLNIQGLLYAYEHQLRGVDCMRGDETYKKRLLAKPLPLIRLRVVAPALLPRLRHAAWLARFGAKQFIRRRAGREAVRTVSLG